MKPPPIIRAQIIPFILALATCLGCASHNVNPHAARPNTGYLDIFDSEGGSFSWDIRKVRGHQSLYTEFKPQNGIVRLALSPGGYNLTITILNTVISNPATVQVEVLDGQLTPIRVRLCEDGTTQVQRTHTPVPGRYTRRAKITADETQSFRLDGDVLPSIPYLPKDQVPYALNR